MRGRRGAGWEACLRQIHARYRWEGKAVVYKTDPPVRRIGSAPRGAFVAKYEGTGPVDFFGVLSGGRMVAFDAKDCKGARWGLDKLHKHQARCLDGLERMGALCFVALRAWGSTWVLPWGALGPLWWAWQRGEARRGQASVSEAMAREWGLECPEAGDWLGALGER